MSDDDRSFIFERLLDDLELYFAYKADYNKKVKRAFNQGEYDTGERYWEERDTLEAIRERARRALDEYVDSAPAASTEPESGESEQSD